MFVNLNFAIHLCIAPAQIGINGNAEPENQRDSQDGYNFLASILTFLRHFNFAGGALLNFFIAFGHDIGKGKKIVKHIGKLQGRFTDAGGTFGGVIFAAQSPDV